jgi:hypothetical protein
VTLYLTPAADAYVSLQIPSANYGTAPTLYAGKSTSTIGRILMRFDLGGIPSGATVLSASLRGYLVEASTTPAQLSVEVRRASAAWGELSVNWSNQPATTSIGKSNAGGTAPGYYLWDIQGLVQDWVNGGANFGLSVVSLDEGVVGWRGFASRENLTDPYPPQLVLTYQ